MAQGSNKEPHADALDALAALSGDTPPAPLAAPRDARPVAPREPVPPKRAPAPVAPSVKPARPPVPRVSAPPAPTPTKAPPASAGSNDPLAALAAAASNPTDDGPDESASSNDANPHTADPRGETADSEAISASGFVGMLAKGKLNERDPELPPRQRSGSPGATDDAPRRGEKPRVAKAVEGETPGNLRGVPRQNLAVPVPRSAEDLAQAKAPRENRFNTIAVAREVKPTSALDTRASADRPDADEAHEGSMPDAFTSAPTRSSPRRGPRPTVPSWYKGALPVMFTLTGILTLIGVWAIGAVACMLMNVQGYPLIDFDADNAVFTAGSKLMAGAMLAALPIALFIAILAILMQRQIKRAERR